MSEEIVYKGYRLPKDRLYDRKHAWIKIEGSKGIIGITDYAQKKLKSIIYIEPVEEGREVNKGELLTTIESIKAVGEVYSPVSGKVIKYNSELDDDPGLINRDPYGRGWIVEIELSDVKEAEELLSADGYIEEVIKKEE